RALTAHPFSERLLLIAVFSAQLLSFGRNLCSKIRLSRTLALTEGHTHVGFRIRDVFVELRRILRCRRCQFVGTDRAAPDQGESADHDEFVHSILLVTYLKINQIFSARNSRREHVPESPRRLHQKSEASNLSAPPSQTEQ